MSGDFSRKTFNQKKHYNGVLMQQGRVQLDADWNEQLDIQQYRTHTETKDVIGSSGVPKYNDGFRIGISAGGNDLGISPGRIYAGGLLCELENLNATYFNQPYYPNPDTSYLPPASPSSPLNESFPDIRTLANGMYLIYLDAWMRDINQLDDPHIQEVALGEADTTIRTQTVWQVKLLKVSTEGLGDVTCNTPFAEWEKITAPATGKLNAQTIKNPDNRNPCVLPPGSGYRRLENQLYRVEVQNGGARSEGTFKWSRDNASVETAIEDIKGSTLTVTDIGKDEMFSFAGDQWVEIVDEEATLKGKPNALVQIDLVKPETREITGKTPVIQYKGKPGLKLRRWDQSDKNSVAQGIPMAAGAATDGWIELEDGVQVKFSDGNFHAGDYWLIPARTASGEIEWPLDGTLPIEQPPIGIHHHYCCLALLRAQDQKINLSDCRKLFPALTEVNSLLEDLEEQERLTRTYLLGFGIICGLELRTRSDVSGKINSLTITGGYGVTSQGYLINQPLRSYEKCSVFNPLQERYYDRFIDSATSQPKFNLWELKEDDIVGKGDILFSDNTDFLSNKVVVLFAEILKRTGKNYNPKSCDDYGRTYRITIKPLLIEKANLDDLLGSNISIQKFRHLKQMQLPRFGVEAADLNTAQDIFAAYYAIISKEFLAKIQNSLHAAYVTYHGLIADMYTSSPFDNFVQTFEFLLDGSHKASFNLQYYYDFFSDLQQTYNELNKIGFLINKSGCIPRNPFPRHLILGNIKTDSDDLGSNNRTYFTPSPLLEKQYELVQQLRSLFRKLVLMIENIPVDSKHEDSKPQGVIITPSNLGEFTLSQKAIPFYYSVENEASSLLRFWSYEKTLQGIANQNLSYYASEYAEEDFVKHPLEFELEPYNFLRIEGILGNQYKEVSSAIKKQINDFRLPIKFVGLQTGNSNRAVREVSLASFLGEHPGIQHKAGVTMGGTFILIYKGASDESEPNIKNGTVIADFYLPYICCAVSGVKRGEFNIQPRFLFDDAHNYPFTVQPAPGSITEIENNEHLNLLMDENNQLFLHPAMELDKTLQTTLTYNDIELDITIVKPDAAFTLTIFNANGQQVKVEAKNKDATNYEWTINQAAQTILPPQADPPPLTFSQLLQFQRNQLTIELEITYNINDQISTDINSVMFTLDQVKAVPAGQSVVIKSHKSD